MTNKELAETIYGRYNDNIRDNFYGAEDFYNRSFTECMNEVLENYCNNEHESAKSWENGWMLEIRACESKSGNTETVYFEKENFIEFFGSEEKAREYFEDGFGE